ncbi:MAG: LacI family transcriptional regulator [Gemmataceae bacterium]|nr:LacI family transcriptional regulator [Gemmataceae bacterium]
MTIREVAKKAGVSLQTVSNVLNGRTTQMGAETRERVLRSIQELGYLPNAHARGLRSQRSATIAFLTVDPSPQFLSDPFHGMILSGMADALRERDYCLLLQALPPGNPAETFRSLYGQRRFDGAVVHLSGTHAERQRCMQQLNETGCPFVLLEEHFAGPCAASVRADNRQGAERAVGYLRGKGHKRIGFLTAADRPWPAVEERIAGYQAALKVHKLPGPREWRVDVESVEASLDVMKAVLQKETAMTAVLCSNDVMAVGAIQAAKKVGRRVPEDLAVVGFDDFEFTRYVDPPLTTVRLPGADMGRRAAELLLDCLQDGSFRETQVVFPTTLIERGTA